MRLLLDTHVLLWLRNEPRRIRPDLLALLGSRDNDVFVSLITGWEIAIKVASGKLRVGGEPRIWFETALSQSGLQLIAILPDHLFRAAALPLYHRDPFDRALVAQAQTETLSLITHDAELGRYGIPIIQL